jgi:hypothetical protein
MTRADCDVCHSTGQHNKHCPIGHVDINDRRAMSRAEWNYRASEDATWD